MEVGMKGQVSYMYEFKKQQVIVNFKTPVVVEFYWKFLFLGY